MSAKTIIEKLGLKPHPEGGWCARRWTAAASDGERPSGTAIYYLLEADQRSHWHRIDATEIWHFHAGAPIKLSLSHNGKSEEVFRLGPEVLAGDQPQVTVPPHCWQAAQSLGAWTLVGCTVSPGFLFETFELAPDGWSPG